MIDALDEFYSNAAVREMPTYLAISSNSWCDFSTVVYK